MTVFNLAATTDENTFSDDPFKRDDPRALAWRDLSQRFKNAREAHELIENNVRPSSRAAAKIGRSDLVTDEEIRDAVRQEWDHVLFLSQLIHHNLPQYWIEK